MIKNRSKYRTLSAAPARSSEVLDFARPDLDPDATGPQRLDGFGVAAVAADQDQLSDTGLGVAFRLGDHAVVAVVPRGNDLEAKLGPQLLGERREVPVAADGAARRHRAGAGPRKDPEYGVGLAALRCR